MQFFIVFPPAVWLLKFAIAFYLHIANSKFFENLKMHTQEIIKTNYDRQYLPSRLNARTPSVGEKGSAPELFDGPESRLCVMDRSLNHKTYIEGYPKNGL